MKHFAAAESQISCCLICDPDILIGILIYDIKLYDINKISFKFSSQLTSCKTECPKSKTNQQSFCFTENFSVNSVVADKNISI
jgi:hypothetical protein